MASSSQRVSASIPSTEPSAPQWKYDLFLSFRGEETRKGIAFELYDGLKNRGGIKTFMDDQELEVGAPISPSLLKAIEESRFAIIILSKNYAFSSWCLEELTKIVDCMKDDNRILPLFYHVEPSDVRFQKNNFEVAFKKHEETKRHDRETVKQWREALKTVANFSGWATQNYKNERELVKVIVKDVCNKVGRQMAEHLNLQTELDKLSVAKATMVQAKDACLDPDQNYQEFDSRASTVEKIMDELRSPNCDDIILVHGIGGVGKTTLAEQVLRQADKEKLFDDLFKVRDVKKPNLGAIQQVIAEKLGLDISKIQTKDARANEIYNRIKPKKTGDESKQDKKTLVLIDDVWEEIDFKAVGLPHTSTCRILLTSRTSKLFSADKRNQKAFQLGALGEEETRLLFEKRAGSVVEGHDIRTIATQLAKKCGGLPVLVVAVASSLRNQTEESIWRDALRSLEEFDKEEEFIEKAYLGLEWSYTQLHENLKPLFLLCGTIAEGNSISLTNLLKCGMGVGIFKKTKNVKQARDLLSTQVRKLKDSSLLLDGDDDTCVRMHDLVHHVVYKIASRDHHVFVQDGADDELKEWPDKDLVRGMRKMSLRCCNIATFREVPWECPEVEMFHLHNKKQEMFHLHNKKQEMFHLHNKDEDDDDENDDMPSNFFEGMKKLKVLGLNNLSLISLPPSLKCLENLQTLCLDGCKFEDIALVGELRNLQILSIVKSKVKQLPKEIEQLTRLRLLDLSDCNRLEVISPGVISNLTSLEELRMRNSFGKWQGTKGFFDEISSNNASLSELKKLSKLSALEIRIWDADILPPDLFSDILLERYQIIVGGEWDRTYETTLNTLKLRFTSRNELDQGLKMLLKKCDVLSLTGWWEYGFPVVKCTRLETIWHGQLAPGSFGRLREFYVDRCDNLRSIFSASMATSFQQLQKLKVTFCDAMETIVAKEEGRLESTTPHPNFVFPKVKSLTFSHMSTLRSFYPGLHTSEWPLLEDMTIQFCDKVKLLAAELSIVQERQYAQTNQPFFLINQEVMFNYLTTLRVYRCDGLKCLFSSSVARNFKKLKHLEVSGCKMMEQIISTTKQDEEHYMFGELKSLRLEGLPNLARFCTGKSIEFPLLEKLYIEKCIELGAFVGGPMTKSSRKEETRERESEENFLFDVKVRFPRLEIMHLKDSLRSQTIWQCQLAQGSFGRLRKVTLSDCNSLRSIFPPSMMGRLNALETLDISSCESMEVVFDERGETNVNETHGTSDPQLKDEQNTISVKIGCCPSLKYIFSSLMATRCLPQLQKLKVGFCCAMETIVAKEEGRLESTTPHPHLQLTFTRSYEI